MMTVSALLEILSEMEVGLSTNGRQLFVTPQPGQQIAPHLQEQIKRHRQTIIIALEEAGEGKPIKFQHVLRAQSRLEKGANAYRGR